jgi:hypothetical protein
MHALHCGLHPIVLWISCVSLRACESNRASEVKLSEKLLGRLKKTIEKVNNIAFAAIIGSIVRQGKSFHDIDIAVNRSAREV